MQKLEKTKKWADEAVSYCIKTEIPEIKDELADTIEDIKRDAAERIATAEAHADAKINEARQEMDENIQKSRDAKQQLADMSYSCN